MSPLRLRLISPLQGSLPHISTGIRYKMISTSGSGHNGGLSLLNKNDAGHATNACSNAESNAVPHTGMSMPLRNHLSIVSSSFKCTSALGSHVSAPAIYISTGFPHLAIGEVNAPMHWPHVVPNF